MSNVAYFQHFFEKHNIDTVRAIFPDVNGCARGKIVPAGKFLKSCDEGIRFPRSVMIQDIEGENSDVPGFDFESGDADFTAVPDPSTAVVVPWKVATAQVILEPRHLSGEHHGQPLSQSCRTALKNVITRLEAAGFQASVASELEFYLFEPGHKPIGDGRPAYSMMHVARFRGLVESMVHNLHALGLDPEAGLHEYAPGQIEINFGPLPPLEMADRTFYFKHMVKEMAMDAGLEATFLAKPIAHHSGSGFHLHMSLWRDGQNAFWDEQHQDVSSTLMQFVAGNQRYARELFSIFSSNINSFRRYVLGEYVPTSASWGGDDRTVALRLPAPTPKAARLEHRIAGADANPHLLIAAILAAGIDAIEHDMTPPSEDTRAKPFDKFPTTPEEALRLFETSDFSRRVFGPELMDVFVAVKRQELKKFHGQISRWELDTFGTAL